MPNVIRRFRRADPRLPGLPTRSLQAGESHHLRDHLMRLTPEDRRLRFHGHLSQGALDAHVAAAFGPGRHVIGWFEHGVMRAAAELAETDRIIELAVTVEGPWRRRGVGRALLLRARDRAAAHGADSLVVHAARGNGAMIGLATSLGAAIAADGADVEGVIPMPHSRPLRFIFDLARQEAALARRVIDRGRKAWRGAA